MQSRNGIQGSLPCDYSRAAQVVCMPAEVAAGSLCGCMTCCGMIAIPFVGTIYLCTIDICWGMMFAVPAIWTTIKAGRYELCENSKSPICFTLGYNIGAFFTRALTRTLGFLLGLCCYPCEKYSRNYIEKNKAATYTDNKSLLFSCVSKEKIDAVNFTEIPWKGDAPPTQRMIDQNSL